MAQAETSSTQEAGSARIRPELIIIVGGLIATAHASMMIIIPALPRFMDNLGPWWFVSVSLSYGIALSASFFGRFFTNIPAGIISERIGRKPVIVTGAVIVGIFATLSGTAESAPVFWIYRLLIGIGSAMTITVANVVATDLSTVGNRGRVLGLMHGMHLIVGLFTPALGGFLAAYVSLRTPFYVSGASVLVFGLWALLRLPDTRPTLNTRSAGTESRRSLGAASLLRDPSFFVICMIGFATFFLRGGATVGLIPEYMASVLGENEATMGILFTVSSIIHSLIIYPAGAVADRVGRKPIIVPSGILAGFLIVAVPFATDLPTFVIIFIALHTVIGWGGQAPVAYLGDIAPPGQRGAAFGMYRTFGDLAGIVAPLITFGLLEAFNYEAAFGFGAVLWTAAVVAFWFVAKESAGPRATHTQTRGRDPSEHSSRSGH